MSPMPWAEGRGRLGVLQPLLGVWVAEVDSPQGRVRCTRRFERVLDGSYARLSARWEYADTVYEELALYGVDKERQLRFWSFTSDGKQSTGVLADASDVHPQAIAFQAQMPAGLARTIRRPDDEEGFPGPSSRTASRGGTASWSTAICRRGRPRVRRGRRALAGAEGKPPADRGKGLPRQAGAC